MDDLILYSFVGLFSFACGWVVGATWASWKYCDCGERDS